MLNRNASRHAKISPSFPAGLYCLHGNQSFPSSQTYLQRDHTPKRYFQSQLGGHVAQISKRHMGGKGAGDPALPQKKVYLASQDAAQAHFSSSTSTQADGGHLASPETSQEGWDLC